MILPSGASQTYTYDNYHNVLTSTSPEGVVSNFTYDTYGNNTKAVSYTHLPFAMRIKVSTVVFPSIITDCGVDFATPISLENSDSVFPCSL